MNKKQIKLKLIEVCQNELINKMKEHEKAMADAQEEANYHKGAMESRYDSFKEEAQEKKNSHAKQVSEIAKLLAALYSIKDKKVSESVTFGSIVEAEPINYFMFSYIVNKPITLEGKQFLPINLLTPLGKLLAGKKKNDIVNFKDKTIKILDVY